MRHGRVSFLPLFLVLAGYGGCLIGDDFTKVGAPAQSDAGAAGGTGGSGGVPSGGSAGSDASSGGASATGGAGGTAGDGGVTDGPPYQCLATNCETLPVSQGELQAIATTSHVTLVSALESSGDGSVSRLRGLDGSAVVATLDAAGQPLELPGPVRSLVARSGSFAWLGDPGLVGLHLPAFQGFVDPTAAAVAAALVWLAPSDGGSADAGEAGAPAPRFYLFSGGTLTVRDEQGQNVRVLAQGLGLEGGTGPIVMQTAQSSATSIFVGIAQSGPITRVYDDGVCTQCTVGTPSSGPKAVTLMASGDSNRVFAAGDEQIFSSDDLDKFTFVCAAKGVVALAASGPYVAWVAAIGDAGTGTYSVYRKNVGAAGDPVLLAAGLKAPGTIAVVDSDVFVTLPGAGAVLKLSAGG